MENVRAYVDKICKYQDIKPVEPQFTLTDIEKYEGEISERMREYLIFIVTKSDFVKETEKQWPDINVLEEHLKNGENPNAFYVYDDMKYEADLSHEHWRRPFGRFSKSTPLYHVLKTFHDEEDADTRCLEYIKLFVKYGVNVELGATWYNFDVLDRAVFNGYTQCVKFLLESGANPNNLDVFDRNSLYALRHCPTLQEQPIYDLLVKYGANPNLRTEGGWDHWKKPNKTWSPLRKLARGEFKDEEE
jgi:hypothetical protein